MEWTVQTSAHGAPAASSPAQRGTIRQDALNASYLRWIAERETSASFLLRLYFRRKPGPERQALWTGYWALTQEVKQLVEAARDRGLLLHIGVARAAA